MKSPRCLCCKPFSKNNDTVFFFEQPIFYLYQIVWKTKTLVLVSTASSATTSSLELPALGAHIGPGEEKIQVRI